MRNYTQTILREALPYNIAILESCLQQRLAYASAHNLNAIRGTIEGDGNVQNSFVLGTVITEKNSVVANCIIDEKVTLKVADGARISDCSFHPTMIDGRTVPVFIEIGKDSMLFYVWSGDSFTCGSNNVIAYTRIREMGNSYRSLQGEPLVLGNNCVVYGSFIDSRDDADSPVPTKVTFGNDAILWQSSFVQYRGKAVIGNGLVICDPEIALKLKHGKIAAINCIELDETDITVLSGMIYNATRLDVHGMSFRAGKNLYIGATVSMQHAFDKLQGGTVQLGDDTNIVAAAKESNRNDTTLQLNVHRFTAGDRVTLVCSSENWYSSREPERCVEIGDDCTVILTVNNGGFKGLDKKVPSNSIVTL